MFQALMTKKKNLEHEGTTFVQSVRSYTPKTCHTSEEFTLQSIRKLSPKK
jgi:hypothetical protein